MDTVPDSADDGTAQKKLELRRSLPASRNTVLLRDAMYGAMEAFERISVHELTLMDPGSFLPTQADAAVDLDSPLSLSKSVKIRMCAVLSFSTFLTPLSSTMLTPTLPMVAKDLNIHSDMIKPFLTSVQILGYGVGALIAAPLSEKYGRVPVIHVSNMCFVGWNLACARTKDASTFLAFRALVGLMGTAAATVAMGVIADIFSREARSKAIALFAMITMLAPVLGPTIGGVLGEKLGWHWIFYLLVILGGFNAMISLLCLTETNRTVLELRRLKDVKGSSQERLSLTAALWRPFHLFFSVPVILLPTISTSLGQGLSYLVLSSLPFTFSSIYGLSATKTGLVMIVPAVGMILGMAIPAVTGDRRNKAREKHTEEAPSPERKLSWSLVVPATVSLAGGLMMYGWAAQPHIHCAVSTIGLFLFAFGLSSLTFCATTYTMDCYPELSTSMAAANHFLVATSNGLLPLSGLELFNQVGLGFGVTILAALGIFSSLLLLFCRMKGAYLRQRFPP